MYIYIITAILWGLITYKYNRMAGKEKSLIGAIFSGIFYPAFMIISIFRFTKQVDDIIMKEMRIKRRY